MPVTATLDALDTAEWHARTARLYDYWLSIQPESGGLPGRQHFDPVAVPELLTGLWLLDVQHDPFRLRYRLVGTGIVEAIGHEVTGQWLDEAHPHIRGNREFIERYEQTVAMRMPNWRKGKPRLWVHRDYHTIENLLLPFARDGSTVDMLAAYTVLYRPDGTAAY